MPFRVSSLFKEVFYMLLVWQVFFSIGIGRGYVVFLFHQLDLPGSQIIIDDEQKSRIASSIGILSPLGCILSGTLMDMFGRKMYFIVTFIPQIISWIMIALATTYEMLLYGMIIQGINLGMSFIGNIYISEIALPSHRGALLASASVIYNLGVMTCHTLMYYVSWNTTAWIYAIYSSFSMLSMLLLSESPLWLFSKGRNEAAIRTLSHLRSANIDDIEHEIEDMKKSTIKKGSTSFLGVMKDILGAWKPSLIAIGLQFVFQMTGYTALFGYTILFFNRLRLPIDSSKFAIAYTVASMIGVLCAPVLMQRMNRRTNLMLMTSVMAVCTTVVGVYEEVFFNRGDQSFPFIVPVALYVFSFASTAGVMPIAYSVGTEMYPSEVRGIMNGIFGAFWYITWAGILKLFPSMLNGFDIRIILSIFTAFCLAVVLFAMFVLPETKGKTLNQVQQQYFRKKPEIKQKENLELISPENEPLRNFNA